MAKSAQKSNGYQTGNKMQAEMVNDEITQQSLGETSSYPLQAVNDNIFKPYFEKANSRKEFCYMVRQNHFIKLKTILVIFNRLKQQYNDEGISSVPGHYIFVKTSTSNQA